MQNFMITLFVCSVTMSALVLLYMAATPLLVKRYCEAGRYYTWLVIVTGLIIPFRPQLPNAIVKVGMSGGTAAPAIQIGNGVPVFLPVSSEQPSSSAMPNIAWWQIAAAVWLLGMVLFLAWHVIRHFRFIKMTARWSDDIMDERTLTLFQNLKTQMGISKDVGLQSCYSIGSPMLIGFASPRILLPEADFTKEELGFILKHELVHYKRKDLWYKCLVLAATAVHWFNPIIHMMAKVIDVQCELSCDEEVIRSTGTDTRLCYSETIIGVIRYKSKLKTALSTNFYGGKKGMKKRIFSIMDTRRKKTGAAVLGGILILTLGTGFALAADGEAQNPEIPKGNSSIETPWFSAIIVPSPDIYAPYAAFGITISEDGGKLLYEGQPVRQFVDEKADGWAFYLDESGNGNLSAVRNTSGEITGIEHISAQKAKKYYEDFFAEELDPDFPAKVYAEAEQDVVKELGPDALQKYNKYQQFGITYSEADGTLYFSGQRVRFFIDWPDAGQSPDVLWTDPAGTVNLTANQDVSGQVTGIETISDKKAKEYQSAVDEYNRTALIGLDERVEARVKEKFGER